MNCYPVKTLIDNTGSQNANIGLVKRVFRDLKIEKALSYQLMTFKDRQDEIGNYSTTNSYSTWLGQVNGITTGGGGDAKEGLFLGNYV